MQGSELWVPLGASVCGVFFLLRGGGGYPEGYRMHQSKRRGGQSTLSKAPLSASCQESNLYSFRKLHLNPQALVLSELS